MSKKFELEKNGHRVTTTVATEAVQLKAHGYRDVDNGGTRQPGPGRAQNRTGAPEIVTPPDAD